MRLFWFAMGAILFWQCFPDRVGGNPGRGFFSCAVGAAIIAAAFCAPKYQHQGPNLPKHGLEPLSTVGRVFQALVGTAFLAAGFLDF